jgi:X-Pro dipeptidyl-peptidase
MDNDGDHVRDRVAVDLVRPRTQVKVPVIMEASPYYACCGRGNESEKKTYDANGVISKVPLFYDNYFVPRGYAFVAVDLPGTARSTGCEDVGGPEEVLGAKAVIDWLNGRAPATYADGSPAVAAWTTGKVGMIGKSWDGTVANEVAATGVPGLETIVPISAISSWYDYARFNGVVRSERYPEFLQGGVTARRHVGADAVTAGPRGWVAGAPARRPHPRHAARARRYESGGRSGPASVRSARPIAFAGPPTPGRPSECSPARTPSPGST